MAMPTTNLRSPLLETKSSLGVLILGSLGLWVVAAIPATLWFDPHSAGVAGAAMLLCLLPGAATFYWAQAAGRRTPEMLMIVVLGGAMVRMLVALGGGMALYLSLPSYFTIALWVWLGVFYSFTLAVEIAMLACLNAALPAAGQHTETEQKV